LILPAVLAASAAWAQAATDPGSSTRCAIRLSVALTGNSPSSTLLQSTHPQSQVDTLLQDPAFYERFARFINATFNSMPSMTPEQDAAYWLTKVILANNQPWKELFVGPYRVDPPASSGQDPQVVNDPNGLGYFRSTPWEIDYEGNEPAGYKLRTAYRIQNNIIGLHLVPATNAPGADISATGRQRPQCAGCHYNSVYALDKIARVLTLRQGTGANTVFLPPDPTQIPQTVLGGVSISDDADLVNALVNSTAFQFRACRLAFMYLYGRSEYTCEGPIFDKCVDAFNTDGLMQTALKSVATDPSFCQ
jgi:hypothetical protein